MKYVITGPTGAIGHALIGLLLSNGDEVLAICHRGSKRIKTLPEDENLKILELNLDEYCDFDKISRDFDDFDVFYHFAWNGTVGNSRNDADLQMKNISYSLDAVKLAYHLGCNTFIGAGSQAEYGRVDGFLNADTPAFPENGYGIAKLCAGQLTRLLCEQKGIKHIWTRILSIYGPFDGENSMIISSLKKMLSNQEVNFTKCEQKWDYLYSYDAARALLLLSDKGINGKTYVLGSGNCKELKCYIDEMLRECDSDSIANFGAIPYSDKQVMHLCADINELTKDTGFIPEVDFKDGIKNTVDYVKSIL